MTRLIKAACGHHTVCDHTQGVGDAAMQAASQHVAMQEWSQQPAV